MGTAIYAGVSGLLSQQRRLDVIGNNIANVSTTGYRGGRVIFEDLFSQTLSGASAPSGSLGGVNPVQVGLGSSMASVDTLFNQGSIVTTGIATDLAIQGSGFFILSDGTAQYFTRDGTFDVSTTGLLIDPATGFSVQGFPADSTGTVDTTSPVADLTIPVGGLTTVQPTTTMNFGGNLDSQAAGGDAMSRTMEVFDSLGTPVSLTFTFTRVGASNAYTYAVAGEPGVTLTGSGTINFDSFGEFASVTGGTGSTVTLTALPSGGDVPQAIAVDFSQLTFLAGESTAQRLNQDGLAAGQLESFSVSSNGVITGSFTNGLTRTLGQVALANFSNEGGLLRQGQNIFLPTPASGPALIGLSGTGGRGELQGGALEGSNVDLATEFSNLIVTQRSFQANARTITAADTMLNETVNLVR